MQAQGPASFFIVSRIPLHLSRGIVLFQYVKNGHNKHLDLFTKRDGGINLWHSGGLFASEKGGYNHEKVQIRYSQ
jgi:hypothetical protein